MKTGPSPGIVEVPGCAGEEVGVAHAEGEEGGQGGGEQTTRLTSQFYIITVIGGWGHSMLIVLQKGCFL